MSTILFGVGTSHGWVVVVPLTFGFRKGPSVGLVHHSWVVLWMLGWCGWDVVGGWRWCRTINWYRGIRRQSVVSMATKILSFRLSFNIRCLLPSKSETIHIPHIQKRSSVPLTHVQLLSWFQNCYQFSWSVFYAPSTCQDNFRIIYSIHSFHLTELLLLNMVNKHINMHGKSGGKHTVFCLLLLVFW